VKYFELIKKYASDDEKKEMILFIICEIQQIPKTELYMRLNEEIPLSELKKLENKLKLYVDKNIPGQYIVGHTYFYGMKIYVNKNVLIPRFETEEVVEAGINCLKDFINPCVVDVGTGSGCIALAIKKSIPTSCIYGIDISRRALKVARKNAQEQHLDINFLYGNLLKNFSVKCDMIISNPPYIKKGEEVMKIVDKNEPHRALYSKHNGLYHYEKILQQSQTVLKDQGVIVFEIAYNRKEEMIALASKYYQNIKILKDIRNNNRIMIIRR